jgi:hypothetical protein
MIQLAFTTDPITKSTLQAAILAIYSDKTSKWYGKSNNFQWVTELTATLADR